MSNQPASAISPENQAVINRAAAQQAQRSLEAQARARGQKEVGVWGLVENIIASKHPVMNAASTPEIPPDVRAALLRIVQGMVDLDNATSSHKLRLLSRSESDASETGPEADRVESQPSAVSSGPEGERERGSQDGKPVTLERVV